MTTPFEDLLVVDLSTRLSGAFASRLFGDFGANVYLVEPPDGHVLRHEPPFLRNEPSLNNSFAHAYFNWNKESIVVEDEFALPEIVATADIVVTTSVHSEFLVRIKGAMKSSAVHLSITPHGLDDPLTEAPGNNLTMNARSGWASINGYLNEAPLTLPRDQGGIVGGVCGYIAAAAALRRAHCGEMAELVDVSELEAFALTVHTWGVGAVYHEQSQSRTLASRRRRGDPAPLWDLVDGRMNFGLADFHNWTKAMDVMNLPEQGARPELISDFGRHSQNMRDVVWGMARTLPKLKRWKVFHALAKLRCVIGVVQDMNDLVENEHLLKRDFFSSTKVGDVEVKSIGAPAKLSPSPWRIHRPAPSLDTTRTVPPVVKRNQGIEKQFSERELAEGPLAGTRVLSFGQAWSGTFATELLALLGADVVQIASLSRPDAFRRLSNFVPKGVADPTRKQHPRNTQGHYNSVNLHKREITLDLKSKRGQEILWELIPRFDMVIDNFRPNVLPSWGISLEKLNEVRPGMIWASISGYGESGPYAIYPANGATTEPMAGLSSLHGYKGDRGGMNTGGLYPDPISGYFLVATVLAALSHRDRTGEPQRIDLSMMEAVTVVLGEAVLENEANKELPALLGNHHSRHAPHNIYEAANGEWIAIAVENEMAWHALKELVGDPRLASSDFFSVALRKDNEEQLDELLSQWVCDQNVFELEKAMSKAGICAARVVPLYEIYSKPDVHFKQSKFVQQIEHPEAGKTWLPGRPWRFSQAESIPIKPAPCLGEHNFEVFSEDLGMSVAEYQQLVEHGITGTLDELEDLENVRSA